MGMLAVIVLIGLFGVAISLLSLTVFIPSIYDLKSVSINVDRVTPISSFGFGGLGGGFHWMQQKKIVESDEVDADYYYFYDLGTMRKTIMPGDKIEALIKKDGSIESQRFIWQLSNEGELALPYKDVVAAENKRKKIMMIFGLFASVASFLLYIMLKYSNE